MQKHERFDQEAPGLTLFADPRNFHLDIANKIIKSRREGKQKALVHIATGFGRYMLSAYDMVDYYNGALTTDRTAQPRMLFVSSGGLMHHQSWGKMTALVPELIATTSLEQPSAAGLTFSTFQALSKSIDRLDPTEFDYITWGNFSPTNADAELEVAKYFDPQFELAIETIPPLHPSLTEYFGEPLHTVQLP